MIISNKFFNDDENDVDVKYLESRWQNIDCNNFLNSPFGLINNMQDFRGLSLVNFSPDPKINIVFKNADLSYSSFDNYQFANSSFIDCKFVNAKFIRNTESEVVYLNCLIDDCTYDSSLIGFKNCVYTNCVISRIKLVNTYILNPIFYDCIFRDLKNINFGSSYFMNCRFENAIENIRIIDNYKIAMDSDIPLVYSFGLTACTFKNAKLINLIFNCPINSVDFGLEESYVILKKSLFNDAYLLLHNNIKSPIQEELLLQLKDLIESFDDDVQIVLTDCHLYELFNYNDTIDHDDTIDHNFIAQLIAEIKKSILTV